MADVFALTGVAVAAKSSALAQSDWSKGFMPAENADVRSTHKDCILLDIKLVIGLGGACLSVRGLVESGRKGRTLANGAEQVTTYPKNPAHS